MTIEKMENSFEFVLSLINDICEEANRTSNRKVTDICEAINICKENVAHMSDDEERSNTMEFLDGMYSVVKQIEDAIKDTGYDDIF